MLEGIEVISGVLLKRGVFAEVLRAGTQALHLDGAIGVLRCEVVGVQPATVAAVLNADIQAFDRLDVGEDVIVELVVVVSVLLHVGLVDGVAVIGIKGVDLRHGISSVGVVHSGVGELIEGGLYHAALGEGDFLACIGISHVDAYLKPLLQIGIKVGAERGTVES